MSNLFGNRTLESDHGCLTPGHLVDPETNSSDAHLEFSADVLIPGKKRKALLVHVLFYWSLLVWPSFDKNLFNANRIQMIQRSSDDTK